MTDIWSDIVDGLRETVADSTGRSARFSVVTTSPLVLDQIDGGEVLEDGDDDVTMSDVFRQQIKTHPLAVGDVVSASEVGGVWTLDGTETGNAMDDLTPTVAGTGLAKTGNVLGIKPGGVTETELGVGAVDLAGTRVKNTLPIAKGGTGGTTDAALKALLRSYGFITPSVVYPQGGGWWDGGPDVGIVNNGSNQELQAAGGASRGRITVPTPTENISYAPFLQVLARADSGNWTPLVASIYLFNASAGLLAAWSAYGNSNQGRGNGNADDWTTLTVTGTPFLIPANTVGWFLVPYIRTVGSFGGLYNRTYSYNNFKIVREA